MAARHDVVVLGTSPNALAAAAGLARSGASVLVLSTRGGLGGPTATEAFAPGFRAEAGLLSASLDPEVAQALDLAVDVIRRDSVTALGPRPQTLRAASSTLGLPSAVEHAVGLLRAIHATIPPPLPALAGADAASLGELAAGLRALGGREMHEVLRLLFLPARDFIEECVDPGAARGILGGVAVRGLSGGPFACGTLLNFLHHLAVGDGLFRCTVRGGLGGLSEALADKARGAGAEIRAGVPGPLRIDVEDGVASGVRLPDGSRIEADVVVSDYDARFTLTRLVAPPEVGPEVHRILRGLRYGGTVARINLALRAPPEITGVAPEDLAGTLVLSPDLATLERAWDEGKRGIVSTDPYIEMVIPTVADPSLAPAGQHVLSVWVQHVPYGRGDRGALLARVIDRLAPFAPRLRELVLHQEVLLPEDLEARFGLTEGHLYGGEVSLGQAFFLRPFSGSSGYRTPVDNLYLCGSAAHPAGYSGRSGWNLARCLSGRAAP